MSHDLREILKTKPVETSAPCRIDMGGTLDISTFYYPLRHLRPCTFNMAMDLRTHVRIASYNKGMTKIASRGFEDAAYPLDEAPFDHPLGLMFAIAAYFRAEGVQIDIDSSSLPCSALGGSSSAAVALIAAFAKAYERAGEKPLSPQAIAQLAHAIEESVAGVPCGCQDQLAAVYGGVNAWYWKTEMDGPRFRQQPVVEKASLKCLEKHLLLAYCGIPHESKNINGQWVRQFVSGKYRDRWAKIVACTQAFVNALAKGNFMDATQAMNQETAIRIEMTPDVLDPMGERLVRAAIEAECGARFTGAGGGGCLWAIGEIENIDTLRKIWEKALTGREGACLLEMKIGSDGLRFEA